MRSLLVQPLFYILLVYGLSFLLMSSLVIKGTMKAAAVPLVKCFLMLALFGLTHGMTELLDLVRFSLAATGHAQIGLLTYLSQIVLVVSFVFLLQFGISLLTFSSENMKMLRLLPFIFVILFIAAMLARGITDILRVGLFARHSFGFCGALLSAIGLLRVANTVKLLGNRRLVRGLYISASGFAAYAVFGGLIVNPLGGIPVQLFRSVCAVTIAVASFAVIDIYTYIKTKQDPVQPALMRI